MGWSTKIEPISIYLVTFAILVGSFVESSSPDCNLLSTKDIIAVDPGDTYVYMSAINLNLKNRSYNSCSWNISQKVDHTFLELSRVVLSSKDNLTVVGYYVDKDKNSNVTLYQGSGAAFPGLISTVGCSYITVILNLSTEFDVYRTYSTAFYWNSGLVQLTKDSGSFSFPLNMNSSTTKITNQFSLQPDNEYSDRLIMLNFTQLPENYSFSLDGVQYNIKNSPPAIYFQNGSFPLKFVLSDYSASPILLRYSLVSAECSGIVNLKTDETKQIPFPTESYRKQQLITDIKCAQYFIAPANTKFQLLINSNLSGLAYPGDSVNIYGQNGNLELGLNAPAVMYFRTIENFLSGNQYLVVYDSPYSSNRNADFSPPIMKVIPSTQAETYLLSKDISVTLDNSNKKIVHVLYSQDFTSKIVADFGGITTIKPGQMNIEIYNTDGENSKPIAVLGQFDRLPLVIPSNTPTMRVVYSGTILPLKVTYRLVEANNSCQLLSTFSPTFEVRGGQSDSLCSWYIPQNVNKSIVINPTIVKIPLGKNVTVNIFKPIKTQTNVYSGPTNDFYFPDIVLDNNYAYEFILDTANISKDDLHFFIVAKKNYLNETIPIQPAEKVSTVKSANYPGYYPVGVAQNWAFIGTNQSFALVSFEDVHLVGNHHLSLIASEPKNLSLNGDADLTNVPDYLVRFPFAISLDSKSYNTPSLSNRGFKVGIEYPGLADNIAVKENAVINFLSVNNVSSNPLNIWKVTANDSSSLQSDTILLINITLAESLDKTKAKLNIYDSLSMRSQSIHYANGSLSGTNGFFVGSIKSAFIVYNYTDSLATKANFSLSIIIQTKKCSNSKNYTTKCQKTDRCITDMMICNGIDECGDYTDELFCKGNRPPQPPAPTPASGGGGVNVLVVLFILMPLSAVLGIVGYIYLPQFLLRIRRGRYSEFRDLSEVS